ncbi:MAG: TOBE domain-containing protein, partial [Ruminococcaceae bacterium]|nr:TOBE domain-containing protein [Oscillospiraceae bacterium]
DDEESIAKFSESVIEADVEVTELMGAEIYLYLNAADQKLTARVSSRSNVRAGDKIKIALEIDRVHFFDKETERCIVH